MTSRYGRSISPQPLTAEDRHHGLVSLNLVGSWNDWIKRRVESIHFVSDTSVRRKISVDFRLRSWLPDPVLEWDGNGMHYIPIALLNKEPLLEFDLRDECGTALPLLTRQKNSAIAAAAVASLAQLTVWTQLGSAVGFEALAGDPNLPSNPRLIELPRDLEDSLVRIAYLPYQGEGGAREALDEFLTPELSSSNSLRDWSWRRVVHKGTGIEHWTYEDGAQWRYELARDVKMRALPEDFARLWMVAVPIKHEPGQRRIIKFCYCEHRLEPQLRIVARLKDAADEAGAGGWLGRTEDRLEGLPRDPESRREWTSEHGVHRESERISFPTKFRQGLAWEGYVVEFDVPAVGKGGSYHLDLEAPEGTQIRRATLSAVAGKRPLDSQGLRGARGLQHAHLYVGNLPSGVQGRASVMLKPRATTIVRSLVLLAIGAFVMLALARWKLHALTDRRHGTSGTLAPVFLLFPGIGAIVAARSTEHAMTTSMLFGLRLLAVGVATGPIAGASLLAIARRWPHISLAWWVLVCWSGLLMVLLLMSWRLAIRRRPDGSAP